MFEKVAFDAFRLHFEKEPHKTRILGVDVETTGLSKTDRLVEIAAVGVEFDGVEMKEISYSTLINPGVPIPPETTKVHGITDAMVASAPAEATALSEFLSFVRGGVLIAHNAPFDSRMIRANCERLGLLYDLEMICTLSLAKKTLKLQKYNLGSVAQYYNYVNENAHRAADDAAAALFVWAKMKYGASDEGDFF